MNIKETGRMYLTRLSQAGKPWLTKLGKYGRLWLIKIKEVRKPWPEKVKEFGKLCPVIFKDIRKIWPGDYREVNELLPIVLLVFILPLVIIISPSNVLRIVLGLPLVLFLPGYTLLAALYVRKDRIKNLDRFALSFALSVALVPLIGLLLNYIPGGISLASFFISIALFILIMSVVAWIRRGWLAEGERYTVRLRWPRPALKGSIYDRLLSAALVLAAVAVVGSLIYIIVNPKTQESFTEFYISGLEDRSVYPAGLIAGEEEKILVTIVNRERRTLDYRIEMNVNGEKKDQAGPLTLEDGQKYEAEIGITPETTGARQEVEFILYLDGGVEPHLAPLRLWVDVE